jgi:hypothetical protein
MKEKRFFGKIVVMVCCFLVSLASVEAKAPSLPKQGEVESTAKKTAGALQESAHPSALVKRMMGALPLESAFLVSLRVGEINAFLPFLREGVARWFPEEVLQPQWVRWLKGDVDSLVERLVFSSILGLQGEALEGAKALWQGIDKKEPILAVPYWVPTEATRDLPLLGMLSEKPLLKGELPSTAPEVAWLAIPTKESTAWVRAFHALMASLGIKELGDSLPRFGSVDSRLYEVQGRLLHVEPKEGFVRAWLSPLNGRFLADWVRGKKMDSFLRAALKKEAVGRRWTPALLQALDSSTGLGVYLHTASIKRLAILLGIAEGSRALAYATPETRQRLNKQFVLIASLMWAFFETPKKDFEDAALLWSSTRRVVEFFSSFTQAGRDAYAAGLITPLSWPALTSHNEPFFRFSFDAQWVSMLQGFRDAFSWSNAKGSHEQSSDVVKMISRSIQESGSFVWPMLLASGVLHLLQATVEGAPQIQQLLALLPQRMALTLPRFVDLRNPASLSLSLLAIYPPNHQAKLQRMLPLLLPPAMQNQARFRWQETPKGDCLWLEIGTEKEKPLASCDALLSSSSPSHGYLPSWSGTATSAFGQLTHASLSLDAVFTQLRLLAAELPKANRALPFFLIFLYKVAPFLETQKLFGRRVMLSSRSVMTPQAHAFQLSLQPSTGQAESPVIPFFSQAAPPLPLPPRWHDPQSPHRCLAQAQWLTFSIARQLTQITADQPSLIKALREKLAEVRGVLIPCIRKDPQLQPHAKRLEAFWETEWK